MSTNYRFARGTTIRARDLFDGRLEEFGVREHFNEKVIEDKQRILRDARNCLFVYIDDDFVSSFTRWGMSDASKILNAVSEAFDVDIFSEHEPQYWGVDTQQEWDACMDEMAEEQKEAFYAEVVKFVRGEPNDIKPGTIGMQQAQIVKALVEKDASLLLPENKDNLLAESESIWDREQAKQAKQAKQIRPDDLDLVLEGIVSANIKAMKTTYRKR